MEAKISDLVIISSAVFTEAQVIDLVMQAGKDLRLSCKFFSRVYKVASIAKDILTLWLFNDLFFLFLFHRLLFHRLLDDWLLFHRLLDDWLLDDLGLSNFLLGLGNFLDDFFNLFFLLRLLSVFIIA